MFYQIRKFWVIPVIILLLLSSGCSPTPVVPTLDTSSIATQVAGTVIAKVSQVAALTPSATATPVPSNTAQPSDTPTAVPSTPTSVYTPVPASTDTPAPLPDRVEFVGQNPGDNSLIPPNTTFTVTWTLRNAGTTTWTTGYRIRFYAGEQMGGRNSYAMPKEVRPNDTVDISITLTTPGKLGKYQSVWALTNADGKNFYSILANIRDDYLAASATPTVTGTPPTATSTPTRTNTPTP